MNEGPRLAMMVFALMTLMLANAFAQDSARRINFQRGRSSAVVKGVVRSDDTITYLIGARSAQTMDVDISKGAAFRLFTPAGEPLQGGKGVSGATEVLEETGDYRIEVESRSRKRSVPFTIKVAIR
ncbi:MAG: hypothetical protein AABN95_21935 [Acidobacteriota bacterium]